MPDLARFCFGLTTVAAFGKKKLAGALSNVQKKMAEQSDGGKIIGIKE